MYADPTDMIAIRELLHEILRNDPAPLHLGMDLGEIEQGRVTMSMTVSDFMANGHGVCHGGYLFTLADTTLAYCCATAGSPILTRNAEITFTAPAHSGQVITAIATRRVSFGRNQICDVVLEADGRVIAYFTGQGTTPPQPKGTVK
ncbi:PaaI family thioesterase [Kocuria marina]|uniref:PaaI family thioesterase n=1 Tax=Kocuria marina TaxID=223184 RepID=UPI0011A09EC5|nr:hotdog fold thioesterase [Kocuria indica]